MQTVRAKEPTAQGEIAPAAYTRTTQLQLRFAENESPARQSLPATGRWEPM